MKSVLVIGMGKAGAYLASKLQELGNEVMIIDKNEDTVQALAAEFTDAKICDCTNENVVRALDVGAFDVCFVMIGEDFQASLVVTALLKKYGAKYVVAKAQQDIQITLLKFIGADEIVFPERDIAERLAVKFNFKNIYDFTPLPDDYAIFEISIPEEWDGKTLSELSLRSQYGVNIIALKSETGEIRMPSPADALSAKGHAIVVGKKKNVYKLTDKKA
ncbi:MAG: potassium channel family protein [Christensenellales bacterium]